MLSCLTFAPQTQGDQRSVNFTWIRSRRLWNCLTTLLQCNKEEKGSTWLFPPSAASKWESITAGQHFDLQFAAHRCLAWALRSHSHENITYNCRLSSVTLIWHNSKQTISPLQTAELLLGWRTQTQSARWFGSATYNTRTHTFSRAGAACDYCSSAEARADPSAPTQSSSSSSSSSSHFYQARAGGRRCSSQPDQGCRSTTRPPSDAFFHCVCVCVCDGMSRVIHINA